MVDRDLRLGECPVVKAVFVNIALGSGRGIDQAGCIHESELVQMIQLLHAHLIRLQMCIIAHILVGHQVNGHADGLNFFLQVILHDLLPATRKLIQIQQAYRPDGLFRVLSGMGAHPHCTGHQDDREN